MKTEPNLTGVPETMLWTLYNRASETQRKDRVLDCPESLRIFRGLDYDFTRTFGRPDATHVVRALESDRAIRAFLVRHPGGTVVSLGEGLDPQVLRVDDGRVNWITVDLPEAIRVRERFLPERARQRHIAVSALDRSWFDVVEQLAGPRANVFITAQGLLMYLPPHEVQMLLADMAQRFTGELFFDTVPRWVSWLAIRGLPLTRHYTLPPEPWGIDVHEIGPFLRATSAHIEPLSVRRYRMPRGLPRLIYRAAECMPWVRNRLPAMVHARLGC